MSTISTTSARTGRRLLRGLAATIVGFAALVIVAPPPAGALAPGPNTQYCTYVGNEPINGWCPPEFSSCTSGCGHLDPTMTGGGVVIGGDGGGGTTSTRTWRQVERIYTDIEHTYREQAPYSPCNGTQVIADSLPPVLSAEFANVPTRSYRVARTCIRDPRNDGWFTYAWKVTSQWNFEAYQ